MGTLSSCFSSSSKIKGLKIGGFGGSSVIGGSPIGAGAGINTSVTGCILLYFSVQRASNSSLVSFSWNSPWKPATRILQPLFAVATEMMAKMLMVLEMYLRLSKSHSSRYSISMNIYYVFSIQVNAPH